MQPYQQASWHPGGMPIAPQHPRLLGAIAESLRGEVVWSDTLLLTDRMPVDYTRGVFHFSLRQRTSLDAAIREVMHHLGLSQCYDHVLIYRGLADVLVRYYVGSEDLLCLVLFENCRDNFSKRCHAFAAQGVRISQQPCKFPLSGCVGDRPYDRIDTGSVTILGDQLEINLRYLPLQLPPDSSKRDAYFCGTMHSRSIVETDGTQRIIGNWRLWSLARPRDDRAILTVGNCPTRVSKLLADGLNPGRIMTWMKIDLIHNLAQNLFFDFDPFTGQIISIRFVEMRLSDYIRMDPRLDRWLIEAGRQLNHFVRDEQVEATTAYRHN